MHFRRRNVISVLVATIGLGALVLVFRPSPVEVEQAPVRRTTFREVIQSDGVLRSKRRYIVPAFADGDIKRVELEVGDPVKKGQPITELFWDVEYEPVKSPIDGVVSKVFRESAGPIRRGEPIVEVVDPLALEAMVELLTTDAVRVRPGNSARVEAWGGGPPLEARVVRVSQAGFTELSALGVEEERTEVTLDMKEVPPELLKRLGSLFHIEVTIEVARHEKVLVIPVGALIRDGASWAVYRVVEGRAVRTPVEPLARSGAEAMIGKGLEEGDLVIPYPGDLVRDQSRVRSSGESRYG